MTTNSTAMKDSLTQKLESQTLQWSKEIERLRSESEEKMAKAQDQDTEQKIEEEFAREIQSMEDNIELARKKMSELKGSGEDKLDDLKQRIDEWLPSNTN